MAKTIEHLVLTHMLAAERRAKGQKVWAYRLDVARSDAWTFEGNRDAFASALRASRWFRDETKDETEASELWALWDEIKDAETVDHFDAVLDEIYDLADIDRCVVTFMRVTVEGSPS